MSQLITIFGSCRQKNIESFYPISNILDGLNFPHYTKEILQQIRYLKYNNIEYNDTKYCFRSGLLSNCNLGIDENKYKMLKNDFDNTTVFLIEIASRIYYKFNNLYLHHIAVESQYNFEKRHEIIMGDLTDDEIEKDIIQIRDELHPKPFIIISHFATYKHGKRYELIKLIENICLRLNIPFINQTDIIDQYGCENIINDEPVLSHYNDFGHSIISKVIKDKIVSITNL